MELELDVYVVGGESICADHTDDPDLKRWIRQHATEGSCSYCDRPEEGKPVAADFEEFAEHVFASLLLDYGGADGEGIPYETAEGGYQAPTLDTWDVLEAEEVTNDDQVLADLANSWRGQQPWVRRDVWLLSETEALSYSWQRFRQIVLHERRYWFQQAPSDPYEPQAIEPSRMLPAVGSAIEQGGLLRRIEPGHRIFRAHTHQPGDVLDGASRLGAPPPDYAASNRMSPAGIPIFYGAEDALTAGDEVRAAETDTTKTAITVAEFVMLRPVVLVDLSDVPSLPGLFDEEMAHARGALRFLAGFAEEVSGPVRRDGLEHVDYVPTQVFAEWLRYEFKCGDLPIDGVRYRSAHGPGVCVALFFGPETAAEPGSDPTPERPLQLCSKTTL